MSKIERSRADNVDRINRDYERALRRIAKMPLEFEVRRINDFDSGLGPGSMDGVSHLIETDDGANVVALTVLIHYTAYGLAKPVVSEGMTCYCGAFVNAPVPGSIIVKSVKEGLRKRPYFLPYVEAERFSARELLRNKTGWNGLLEVLNADEALRGSLRRLPMEKVISGIDERFQAGRNKTWVHRLNDEDDNYRTLCQVVPLGRRTLVATRHIVEDPKRIEHAVGAIRRIRDHILAFGYGRHSFGRIPQPWANDVMGLIDRYKRSERPPIPEAGLQREASAEPVMKDSELEPDVSHRGCQRCGASVHEGEKYCRSCGASLILGDEWSRCPGCGARVSPEMRFCGACGFSLARDEAPLTCPRCGAEVYSGVNFCGDCGAPLKPGR